ncbi:MAG TPA: bifunctional demethylmenaquinone methyltransferase/2-methoxy-6-polyprenyl-1,4-benzoquinol methylase UbiE [Oligoflexia bacterium]|nr:bifunctional demethylmenaquinone methyltransferase/2-methoxy-6-polyprenyl-1,4-benzoquinol methylase UbiE [Oligoflexia bacterium]HMP47357.1 bifunctional demethylmenaquinone methyltransferase/2-methoxy-6-polyprenyl-1,4-benzoquinol methylase UbiE [Oligoflexia bacterium]
MSKAVHDMFSSIARSYDRANDALSFGVHRLWRKSALRFAGIHGKHPASALDVCCGTGDFCKALLQVLHVESQIIGVDFVFPMLELASLKFSDLINNQGAALSSPIHFIQGDAESLPFNELSFDVCTIGFGIRNVDRPIEGLKEMKRVLRAGGKLVVLEFGTPSNPVVRPFFELYSKFIMPKLGALISGNKSAYEYLPETSARFPCGEDFCDLLKEAGFTNVKWRPFFGGISYVYVGTRGVN